MSAPPRPPAEFPRGFDGHRRAQAASGLRLTPAERLRWLEETMDALRRWRGRARDAERATRAGTGGAGER